MEAEQNETLRETLERLRSEIAELRASCERLVLAADADLRRIERDLHEGVQQHLVALAVHVQLAESLADTDPTAARSALEELGRDVQEALDDTARLAQRIYVPSLENGVLAAELRAAAVSAGVAASVDVTATSRYPPEVLRTVHLAWFDALKRCGGDAPVTISVREDEGALSFEVVGKAADSDAELDRLRDRVEGLGGRLTIRPERDRRTRISGSLPLSRRA